MSEFRIASFLRINSLVVSERKRGRTIAMRPREDSRNITPAIFYVAELCNDLITACYILSGHPPQSIRTPVDTRVNVCWARRASKTALLAKPSRLMTQNNAVLPTTARAPSRTTRTKCSGCSGYRAASYIECERLADLANTTIAMDYPSTASRVCMHRKSEMKLKPALASLIVSTLALPALAQMSPGALPSSPSTTIPISTWYIVQDTSTERCEVTSLKPKTRGKTRAVGKSSYASRTEVESDLSKIPECSK